MNFTQKITNLSALLPIAAFAVILIAAPATSFAAGESGDGGSMETNKDATKKKDSKTEDGKKIEKKEFVLKCFGKRIWDKEEKKCVKEEKSSSLDQDSIYAHGRNLARAGQYNDAIRVLYLAADQSDPRVLNYLGYSNRKLGNMDNALKYYHAAVASNPDFSLVREYLGEAYIQLGMLEKAREQLTQIERICGAQTCREYSMLSNYMIDYQIR